MNIPKYFQEMIQPLFLIRYTRAQYRTRSYDSSCVPGGWADQMAGVPRLTWIASDRLRKRRALNFTRGTGSTAL